MTKNECSPEDLKRTTVKPTASVAVLSPGGVVTREQQQQMLFGMEWDMREAIRRAKEAGVPQGLVIAILHVIALQETQTLIDDA